MKRITRFFVIACCISTLCTSALNAQKINLPPDSLQSLLCRKWEIAYSLMGNSRIDMPPGAPKMTFEFKKDRSFTMTTDNPSESTKGTWAYDPKKKLVQLQINGRSNLTIVSIQPTQMSMVADTKEATPDDPMTITIVYKIKGT